MISRRRNIAVLHIIILHVLLRLTLKVSHRNPILKEISVKSETKSRQRRYTLRSSWASPAAAAGGFTEFCSPDRASASRPEGPAGDSSTTLGFHSGPSGFQLHNMVPSASWIDPFPSGLLLPVTSQTTFWGQSETNSIESPVKGQLQHNISVGWGLFGCCGGVKLGRRCNTL